VKPFVPKKRSFTFPAVDSGEDGAVGGQNGMWGALFSSNGKTVLAGSCIPLVSKSGTSSGDAHPLLGGRGNQWYLLVLITDVWCLSLSFSLCAGLSHGYNGRQLFRDVDLEIEQGERVAIIGPNG
jgi:ABC-type multidrug transport system fused ATPase/permease subunit